MARIVCKRCGSERENPYPGFAPEVKQVVTCKKCRSPEEEEGHREAVERWRMKHGPTGGTGPTGSGGPYKVVGEPKTVWPHLLPNTFELGTKVRVPLSPVGVAVAVEDGLVVTTEGERSVTICSMREFMRTFGPHLWVDEGAFLFAGEFVLLR